MSTSPNYKRLHNYWEPVYAPAGACTDLLDFNWNTDHSNSFKKYYCAAGALDKYVVFKKYKYLKLKGIVFENCDFDGDFSSNKITFNQCTFLLCDLKQSIWTGAKFTECTFEKTSISTTTLKNCHFNNCKWIDLGVSANEMHMDGVLVSNPHEFVCSIYTNTDPETLGSKNTSPEYQRYRLEGTKSKIARLLLDNNQNNLDDNAFYDSIKAYIIQSIRRKLATAQYEQDRSVGLMKLNQFVKKLALQFEMALIIISGSINAWGGSVSRCLSVGGAIFMTFFFLYFLENGGNAISAMLTSLEISLLVGYTKYTNISLPLKEQMLYALNMIISLWWYAIFIPTLVNRISRTR